MLEYLQDYGESGSGDLIEGTDKFSYGYIDKALKELKEMGYIERTNEGGKSTDAIYNLTEEGENIVLEIF